MPSADDLDRDVRLHLFGEFVARGRPPIPVETAGALGQPTAVVEAAYRRLADGRVIVLAPGTPFVWMANPLSAVPTPFEVEVEGRTYFGSCAWDALGIPAMIDKRAIVRTTCADCEQPITLSVDPRSGPDDVGGLVHFTVPARHWWDDIGFL